MSLEIVLIPLAIVAIDGISRYREERKGGQKYIQLDTPMTDVELLKEVLESWECSFEKVDNPEALKQIKADQVTFMLNENKSYSLVLPEGVNRLEYENWLNEVQEAYTHLLQQRVYEKLVQQAKERGMTLETEEVLEDNSIQLTYVINK